MSTNQLSYDGLKVMLQYMEANLRFQLSSRIPSIWAVEKLVPMRFDSISFKHSETEVNNTTYRIGIYRQYPEGSDIPRVHQEDNKKGGTQSNLTENGFRIWYAHLPVSPGDVDIPFLERHQDPEVQQDYVYDADQISLERHIELLERALEIRLECGEDAVLGAGKGQLHPLHYGLRMENLDPEIRTRIEMKIMDGALPLSAEKIREGIQKFRARLVPYYCRRDGIPLPYIMMIQLTVHTPSGKGIYRRPHNIKLHEAIKNVNMRLFGARNCLHQLRSLSVDEQSMVIRLPESFRVRIRELSVTGDLMANYTGLQSIVEASSYPLNVLTISYNVDILDTYNNEIIKTVKQLNISPRLDMPMFSCLPFLRALNTQSVKLNRVFLAFQCRNKCNS